MKKKKPDSEDRGCIWCGKPIPNYRSARAQTCSVQCSNARNHTNYKERDRRNSKLKKK